MLKLVPIAITALLALPLVAQETSAGISIPVTMSAGAMYTERLQLAHPTATPSTAGLQLMLYPTIQLDSHWFAYAAIDARLAPYLYYDAYNPEHDLYANVIQAYVGYTIRTPKSTLVFKAGQLASAFGAFPLRYDDAQNALLDQPLSYIQTLTLRDAQLPCGVKDLLAQPYGSVSNFCGGAAGRARGLTPVTLYGVRGVEADFSGHRFDGRLQFTNSSPSHPLSLTDSGQFLQWTAGAGYTIHQGFRVGVSGFRGPYLNAALSSLLPAGTTLRDFPANAFGIDAQWARGRWSLSGEWQRFQYDSPNFRVSPSVISIYGEAKAIITPRLFLAARAGWLQPGRAVDKTGASTDQFAPSMASYEFAAGSWINRYQLLKGSYEWLNIGNRPGTRFNVLGVQLVTTFHALDRAFHQ